MNKKEILEIATQYLKENSIDYAQPIKFGCLNGFIQEVVFTDPLALDPSVAIIDPSEITVLVNINTAKAALKYDM